MRPPTQIEQLEKQLHDLVNYAMVLEKKVEEFEKSSAHQLHKAALERAIFEYDQKLIAEKRVETLYSNIRGLVEELERDSQGQEWLEGVLSKIKALITKEP